MVLQNRRKFLQKALGVGAIAVAPSAANFKNERLDAFAIIYS